MKDVNKAKLFEEQLRRFKYSVDYKVNESPKYRPLVGMDEVFDEIPSLTNEAGEENPPMPGGDTPQAPEQPAGVGNAPASGAPGELPTDTSTPPAEPPMPPADVDGMGGGEPMPPAGGMGSLNAADTMGGEVDDIQNDIIKHNIAAMQSIHDQLEGLNATVQGLNSKLEVLNADVEEVREPTNSEKLMSKTNVSYPYYFNLNDFWSGNWFNEKRKAEQEKGVRELPDGTFIADFDDLPQKSKHDIKNSFNDI